MPITEMLSQGRRGWRRWGFAAVSVVVHAGLLAALVVATEEEPAREELEPEKVTYVDVRRFAPPPPAASAPSASEQPEPREARPETQPERTTPRPRPEPRTPPRATDIVDPVDSLPDEPLGADVPPPTVAPPVAPRGTRSGAGEEGGRGGVEGGVEGGQEGGVVGGQGEEVPDPGGTFIASVVDKKAELRNRRDLPRLMQRLYPRDLQSDGVGGRVVVQFVVGVNGRVDMSSVKVMSTSHDAFVGPTREALEEFRFTPARVGDREVRMLTQLPIVWEVGR